MPLFPMLYEVWPSTNSILNACSRAAKAASLGDRSFKLEDSLVKCHVSGCNKALMRLKRTSDGWLVTSTLGEQALLDHLERDKLRQSNELKLSTGQQSIIVRTGDELFTFSELKLLELTLESHAMRTGLGLEMSVGGVSLRDSKTRIVYRCQDLICRYGVVATWNWSDDAVFLIENMNMTHNCEQSQRRSHSHHDSEPLAKPLIRMKWTTSAQDRVNERLGTHRPASSPSASIGSTLTPLATSYVLSPLAKTPIPKAAHTPAHLTLDTTSVDTEVQRGVKRKRSQETSSSSPRENRPSPATTPPTSRDTPRPADKYLMPFAKGNRQYIAQTASRYLAVPTRRSARLAGKDVAQARSCRRDGDGKGSEGSRTAEWVHTQSLPC